MVQEHSQANEKLKNILAQNSANFPQSLSVS